MDLKQWIWQQPDWPHFRWNTETLAIPLANARLAQGKALGATRFLDSAFNEEAVAAVLAQDGITTSAIEGERLELDLVRSSVARHLGLPIAGMKTPPRAVDGLVEVLLDATQGFEAELTHSRLVGWQAALFPTGYSGFHQVKTGGLRGEEPMHVVSLHRVQEHIHFTAPDREILGEQVDLFLTWFNAAPTIDGLLRAGIAHLWFITLHPFEDGNGRLARALTDMAMAADERQSMRVFSLSAQILLERDAYYAVLEKTQRGGLDVTGWLLWFLEQVRCAANDAENTFGATIAKAKFWMRHQGISISDRQRKVLNRLLDAGPGGFTSGMNARKYMSLTKTSRATASRELSMLVELGCLAQRSAGGRSTAYDIAW